MEESRFLEKRKLLAEQRGNDLLLAYHRRISDLEITSCRLFKLLGGIKCGTEKLQVTLVLQHLS